MPNMRTEYLGLELAHPFAAGAGSLSRTLEGVRALAKAGASMITLPSLYEEQLRAESLAAYHSMVGSADSYGEATSYLPTPEEGAYGPESYIEHVEACAREVDVPVVASLNGSEPGPWLDYATAIESAGAKAIELNMYEIVAEAEETARSVEDRSVEIVRGLRARTSLPIAVKLSPFYTALPNFAGMLIDAGATGLVLFNRFFEPDVDIENLEHVPHLSLSTPDELRLRLRWLSILSGELDCPMAASGGVHGAEDAVRAIMCGATAVQLVSTLLIHGVDHITTILNGVETWMEEHEYETLDEMRGSMSINRCPNPDALTRAQYVRTLQTWKPV